MAPKKKAAAEEAATSAEPEVKKAKVDEETPKNDEPTEKEMDAKDYKGKKVATPIDFDTADLTLNVIPTMNGKVLTCLSDGGAQCLTAGARANVGMKAGRYLYEVKVIELLRQEGGGDSWGKGGGGWGNKQQQPKQHHLRIGFSTAESSLLFGDGDGGVFFDSDGFFGCNADKPTRSTFFTKDMVMGVLLNLDAKSPNANTISLFRNGMRLTEPKPLPENLQGKALFPLINFRGMSVHVHFGPTPLFPLPFKCRTLQDAGESDFTVSKKASSDGKCEVLLPVFYPDQGTFEWLDGFLAKNPQFTELSDRKLIEWATKSGVWRKVHQEKSNDKPDMWNIPGGKDFSLQRIISSIASAVPRNYVVMEVKQNLIQADRAKILKRFPKSKYKRTAKVVMGDPTAEYKSMVKDKILKQKQLKADAEYKAKQVEREKKKVIEQKKKEIAEKQKAVLEAKKKADEEKKKAAAEAEGKTEEATEEKKKEEEKEGEKPKEEDKKEEEKKEEEKKEEEKKEDEPEEDTGPPVVTLTEEEEKTWFVKGASPDLDKHAFDESFAKFSLPEKAEGFDDIKYEWDDAKKANAYLRSIILEKKKTSIVTDLKPGAEFQTTWADWIKQVKEWEAKHTQAEKPKKKEDDDDDAGDVDIYSVEDVNDAGNGVPLYVHFTSDDWALMQLRWELYTLAKYFKKDVDDVDRQEVPEQHFLIYYNKYFLKGFQFQQYGKTNLTEVCTLVSDTVGVEDGKLKITLTKEDTPANFLKLTEECRRARQRRIDAGDETARLHIKPSAPKAQQAPRKKW